MDITKDAIPVVPAAHYQCGGVVADVDGKTKLPGLMAVGEVACTGLHGANRMGSNSLLEGMVLGEVAGLSAALQCGTCSNHRPSRILRRKLDAAPCGIELGISDLIYSMKSLMWRHVGLERDAELLQEAMEHLSFWSDAARRLAPAEPRAWELVNMLTVANLATIGASDRCESRGVHYRTDYLEQSKPYHTVIRPTAMEDHCVASTATHVGLSEQLTYG